MGVDGGDACDWSLAWVVPQIYIDFLGNIVGGIFIFFIVMGLLVTFLVTRRFIKRATQPIRQLAASVNEVINLDLSDFWVRYLVVDDIWIPLGENILIETFKPAWNRAVDGFGNKDPGRRRKTQFRSPWDVLHPGRLFAEKLAESPVTATFMETRVSDYFANRKMAKLPRKVLEQQAEEEALEQAET